MTATRIGAAAALVLASFLGLAPLDALPRVSVSGRAASIGDLGAAYARSLARLRELALARAASFARGLGWSNDDGHGFQTRTLQAYFTRRYAGLVAYDGRGTPTERFSVNYESNVIWGAYSAEDGRRLTVGYRDGVVAHFEITFADGSVVTGWDSSFRVSYPRGDASYTLTDQRGEPLPLLSPAAAAALRQGDRAVLDDLAEDLPYPYLTRALVAAAAAGVELSDDRELGRFAVSWFRALAGSPAAAWSAPLERAAAAHAGYLVDNGVVARMVGLAGTAVDANVFLELHVERPGLPGFTGASVPERTTRAGYAGYASETANFGWTEPVGDCANWFASVFHRRPFLDPRVREVGYARAVASGRPAESAGVANWGHDLAAAEKGYRLYPRDGERLVPFAWGGAEAPAPFPGRSEGTGPPITVAFTDRRYRGGSLELVDAAGRSVPLLRTEVLPEPETFLEAVPARSLDPGATYTLRFSYGGTVDTSTFSTAPRNPAEEVLASLRAAVAGDPEVRTLPFDLGAARAAAASPGELVQYGFGATRRVANTKYGFSVAFPEGWTLGERSWQQLAMVKGNAGVHFHLYAIGPEARAEDVVPVLAKSIEYRLESSEPCSTPHAAGYRLLYSWPNQDRVVLYCLVLGDYALGIYGWGVKPELMAELFASLRLER